jgi:hypothetical protein
MEGVVVRIVAGEDGGSEDTRWWKSTENSTYTDKREKRVCGFTKLPLF